MIDSYLKIVFFAASLAVFAVLSRKKSEYGVCLAAFFLPLYVFKFDFFGLPLNFFEVSVYFLFLIWFSRGGFGKARKLFSEIKENRIFAAGLILFFAGVLISTVLSDDLRTSAGILKGWFIAPFLLFLIVKSEIKTENQIKNIFRALSFSGAAVASVSLGYFFAGRLTFDGRLAAFYLSPNHLAMYLAPISVLTAGLFFLSPNRREKTVFAGASVLTLAVLYLTYSFGAWAALFSAAAVLFLLGRAASKLKLLAFSALAAVILILFSFQIGGEKFQNLFSERSSLASRVMIWKAALAIGKDNPVFGVGPGMFQKYYLEYQKFYSPYLEWAVPQPHNLFLAFWLQTGIAGFLGFILIIVSFFRKKTAALFKKEAGQVPALNQNGGQAFGNPNFWLILAMLVILIHGLIDTPYFKNDLSSLFWIILAL